MPSLMSSAGGGYLYSEMHIVQLTKTPVIRIDIAFSDETS
jgi:hypothetical protein